MKTLKTNTELCVDLKTKLQHDVLMVPGKDYPGVLVRDVPCEDFGFDEHHYTFLETLTHVACKRNPHVFIGRYITVTRREDGSLRPNFRPLCVDKGFSIRRYAMGVAEELTQALTGLVEEK